MLRLGLLSTARINAKLAAGARVAEGVEVVAIGSRDGERARAQADELGVPRAHGSYEDVLADPEVDAVYIPLPNQLHVDWSIRALEAGKHVLCEKPLARSRAEAQRAADAAASAGRVLAEAFMWRHHPQAKRLLELAEEIGPVRLVRAAFGFPLNRPGDIRLAPELEGGALMDVGCYCVSASRRRAPPPTEVTAQCAGDAVDVRTVGTMSFQTGALAVFDCGFDVPFRDELEVVGERGSLFLDDPWHSRTPRIERRAPDGTVETIEIEAADPYGCQLEDFARACAGHEPPRFGPADAVAQAAVIERLYAAAGR